MTFGSKRPLLIHAHPGHELRLFRWMEENKPILLLLTDGSGGGSGRTEYSRACTRQVGALPGSMFGSTPDRDWYHAILTGEFSLFEDAVDAVVQAAISNDSPMLVSDAVDGYNPMHDLCEAIAAASAIKLLTLGKPTLHLVSRATPGGEGSAVVEVHLEVDDQRRKKEAITAYTPLAEEAARFLRDEPEALHTERLLKPSFDWSVNWTPDWERIGAERVAASKYARRIEYLRHVRPIAQALLGEHGELLKEHVDCAS